MDFKWLALLSFVVHLWPKLNVISQPCLKDLVILTHYAYLVFKKANENLFFLKLLALL